MTPPRRLVVAAAAALIVLGAIGTAASARDPDAPDLKVAIRTDAGCGPFADSLPPVITETAAAGVTVADVTLCVQSVAAAGRSLTIGVEELVDVDAACTGDEASVDASCGADGVGELSGSLVQLVGAEPCRRNPRPDTEWQRSLPALSATPVQLTRRLNEDWLLCVRLVLRYEPDDGAGVVSQSDRTSWRYSFMVSDSGR